MAVSPRVLFTTLAGTAVLVSAAAAAPAAVSPQFSLKLISYPAKIAQGTNPTFKVALTNLGSTPLAFADVKANRLAFELQQQLRGTEWAVEAEGYSYFRDLAFPRKLQPSDFGVIKPGKTGTVVLAVHNVSVSTTAPTGDYAKFWSIVGKDRSGKNFYLESKNPYLFSCGTDTFVLELGKVTGLHEVAGRGLMNGDIVNTVSTAKFKMDTSAIHQCG